MADQVDRMPISGAPERCAALPHDHSGFAEYGCPACDYYASEALNDPPDAATTAAPGVDAFTA